MISETSTTYRNPALISGLLMAVGMATAGVILFWFDPAKSSFYPTCLFHKYTGWNCPGCGSTRAMHALLHGQFGAALRDNILLIGSLPFAGYFFIRHLVGWASGRPVPWPVVRGRQLVLVLAVLTVFTVLRNIPIAPFTFLSPP
jgi:hypothetical protein